MLEYIREGDTVLVHSLDRSGPWRLPDSPERLKKWSHFCYSRKILNSKRKREMTQMDLSTFDQVEQISQESLQINAASLYQAFEQVKDGRGKKGRRFPLALILTLIMLGKMVGQPKIEGTINWINEREQEMRRLLNWPRDFPSHRTYIRALVFV